jgi:hypothetical protein
MEVGAGLTCKFVERGVALARVFLTMATGVRLEGWSYGKAEWPRLRVIQDLISKLRPERLYRKV